tara:strand:+ start:7800 stop:8390 length:591 start_codon:yes stop_codon:yes gene_type:complete
MIVAFLTLGACSNNAMYEIVQEQTEVVNSVPKWFMADYSEIKSCGDNEKDLCIFGAGTSVSPDLNLAVDKAKMIAKAELADMIRGEMNKSSKQIVTEVGKSYNKTVVAEAESILINTIKETPVRGYEVFAQDITLTSNGYYRAYVGLRLPMGSLNVMYKYTVDEAVNAYNNNRNDGSTIDSIEWPSFDEDESNNIQ